MKLYINPEFIPITVLILGTLGILFVIFLIQKGLNKWWWIDVTKDVPQAQITSAKKAALVGSIETLPRLPFTESNFRWVLLYDHIRAGQISPVAMHRMHRSDLEYIVGMEFAHPDLIDQKRHFELTKIQGNVSRAKYELSIRNLFWTLLVTGITATAGGFFGATIGR